MVQEVYGQYCHKETIAEASAATYQDTLGFS